MRRITVSTICVVCIATSTFAQHGAGEGEWISEGGARGSAKYSPLFQINAGNVDQLVIAWQWDSIANSIYASGDVSIRPGEFKATPIVVNGLLYTSTSYSQVAAIDPGRGTTVWAFDSEGWRKGRPANLGYIHRGVSYWEHGEDKRIIIATGDSQLIALNALSGERIESFGNTGSVDLFDGLGAGARLGTHQVNSPPAICGDVVVVGNVIFDRPATQSFVRGDVRGFDVRTGEKLWQFHSIPQEGEFGNDTWESDAWKFTGNTNVWSLISADPELGYVYLPFGVSTNDFYGGHRPGDNLFANSLVCLNAQTGQRVWHFQTVHHDVWDYDIPAAPNLVDIVVDGKEIKAVAQVSKTGFCYVFDRVTGEPVWPIEERPVPQSNVPGEKTSATQPFPTKPAPFAAQGLTDNIIDYTSELKAEALEILKEYNYGPMFTPPSTEQTIIVPGDGGGANWTGSAVDPDTATLYVPSISYTSVIKLVAPDPNRSDMKYLMRGFTGRVQGPRGLPLLRGPYSTITAIDLNTGDHRWQVPMGTEGLETHPELKGLNVEPTGDGRFTFPLLTKSLLIAARRDVVLALDKDSGRILAEIPLRGSDGAPLGDVSGTPMTYVHDGKQYVVLAVTGEGSKGSLVALALP